MVVGYKLLVRQQSRKITASYRGKREHYGSEPYTDTGKAVS